VGELIMPWSIHYTPELHIITVETTGIYTPAGDLKMLTELKEHFDLHGCTRVLIDHRKAEVKFKFVEIFDRPNVYDFFHLGRDKKAALVFRELQREQIFFENICVNRGFNCKVFDDYDAGLKWLVE
jgi:hypothetical protein